MTNLTLDALGDIRVSLNVMLGRALVPIAEVLRYAPGTIVPLDVPADAPAPLLVNGIAIATGGLVTMEDGSLAFEISDVLAEAPHP